METKETKICKGCGRELPIENFPHNRNGRVGYCRECMSTRQSDGHKHLKENVIQVLKDEASQARLLRLSQFTPRELMEELARRGYKGKLQYVRVEEIDITKF